MADKTRSRKITSKEEATEVSTGGAKAAAPKPVPCPVAGFGASAGGLEAFTEVLQHLPSNAGLAIVFVQHLDPKHGSILSELLARATAMPVRTIVEATSVKPNHVYVMPPNVCVTLRERALHIEPRHPNSPHMPIDHFFRSLAADQGSRAVGVVLSGTASDGTLGLKAIKAEGGITFAQAPESARYDGMPRSAIAAGCVDAVLSPERLAAELLELCQHPYLSRLRTTETPPEPEPDLRDIFSMLRAAKGVDFTHYKPGTIRRRTMRRMALLKLETPEQYVRYLKEHRDEIDLLFQDILINVTGFFREPATFDAITSLMPTMLKGRSAEDPLRVWVPGCSTGEEAYSVGICLLENLRRASVEAPVQLFGTDLSEAALEKARAGIYPDSIASDVSEERLRKFFLQTNGMYQIARTVRDMCVFARQDVTKDPPFSRLDLVVCRNVLIYLGPVLQTKVLRIFHYALKPTGYLVLGASESIGSSGDLFGQVNRQHRIYSRKATTAAIGTDFGVYEEPGSREIIRKVEPSSSQVRVDQILLSRYSPPAVVVDKELRVLQFRGQTSPFLEHQPGHANLNISSLARGELGLEVRKLVQDAHRKATPVRGDRVVRADPGGRSLTVSVLPVPGLPDPEFLVVFEDAPSKPAASPNEFEAARDLTTDERIRELEQELAATRQYLQSVIEEQEAATEELKSAHEEVQSSNEELQSTNEELLTTKEELQSTNEELTTVNEEMQSRNAELQQVNNDLLNLLSSVTIPIVMLGNDLRIRRYTPQAERILNLIPTDMGRPISDFRLKINVPDLDVLCREVIDTLVSREREVVDSEGRTYSMWVRPYRTADSRIDGVVLALIDVTERKQVAEARFRRLFEAAKDGMIIADAATGEIVDSNPFITKLFGYPRSRLIGVKFWECDLFRGSEVDEGLRRELSENEAVQRTLVLAGQSGEHVHVDIGASLYAEGERRIIQFNIRDISARHRLEEKMRRNEEQTRHSQKMEAVGRLAGGVAHDFNNILTAVLGYTELLGQELDDDDPRWEKLEHIRTGAERAVALTKQLLAFGRRQVARPSVLKVNEVITEMQQMASVMLTGNVDLALALNPEAGAIRADRNQIEQVVLNLVLNARDAMPGGGTITVTTANVDVDETFSERHPAVPVGRYVSVTVKDTGSGMDEETKARIFEPFFTTKPKGRGVGLGLATAYSIVRQGGGYIWAYSELGVGSTFTVYLPRVEGEPVEEVSGAFVSEEARGTETILVVEDEAAIRSLTRRFLEQSGYRVLDAPNGPEALHVSRGHNGPIHLMVTDVVMPRMSGRELAFQLAPERPDMAVLYMSGHTEDAIIHHGVLEDRLAFLQKPFTQRALLSKVRQLLDRKPEQREETSGEAK